MKQAHVLNINYLKKVRILILHMYFLHYMHSVNFPHWLSSCNQWHNFVTVKILIMACQCKECMFVDSVLCLSSSNQWHSSEQSDSENSDYGSPKPRKKPPSKKPSSTSSKKKSSHKKQKSSSEASDSEDGGKRWDILSKFFLHIYCIL